MTSGPIPVIAFGTPEVPDIRPPLPGGLPDMWQGIGPRRKIENRTYYVEQHESTNSEPDF